MKTLICVLFHNGQGNPISDECRERLLAARKILASEDVTSVTLAFVGGGGLHPSGAERLARFQADMPNFSPQTRVVVLGNSSTTVSNIEEISEYSRTVQEKSVVLVTHSYHAKRIGKILRSKRLPWEIVTVESQIVRKNPPLLSKVLVWCREQCLMLLLPVDKILFQSLRKRLYRTSRKL